MIIPSSIFLKQMQMQELHFQFLVQVLVSQFFIGVTATGTVGQSGGVITGVTITNAGTGYTLSTNNHY